MYGFGGSTWELLDWSGPVSIRLATQIEFDIPDLGYFEEQTKPQVKKIAMVLN